MVVTLTSLSTQALVAQGYVALCDELGHNEFVKLGGVDWVRLLAIVGASIGVAGFKLCHVYAALVMRCASSRPPTHGWYAQGYVVVRSRASASSDARLAPARPSQRTQPAPGGQRRARLAGNVCYGASATRKIDTRRCGCTGCYPHHQRWVDISAAIRARVP